MHRRCGEVAKAEAALLKPVRERHLSEGRMRVLRAENNVRVLGGEPVTTVEKIRAAQDRARIRGERGDLTNLMTPAEVETQPAPEPDCEDEPNGLASLLSTQTTEPDYDQD